MDKEQLLKKYGEGTKVLDHGFVRLVDVMGDDSSITQAARVSYGKGTKTAREDRGLIRYLIRRRHTSPLEMCEIKLHCKMPIFVARQWIRHRTACLSSDTALQFDLPGGIQRRGNQLYTLTVGEVWARFQPTENRTRSDKQKNPFHKREAVQKMHLRCINEETGAVQHTKIVDIWQSGVKKVYRVELASGAWAKMSEDHMCLTVRGWLPLRKIVNLDSTTLKLQEFEESPQILGVGPGVDTGVVPSFNPIDETTETWKPIFGWEDFYEVSDQGRVRRIVGGRGSRSFGRCKKLTPTGSHAVVSLNRPGYQITQQVHSMVLEAFVGKCPSGMECLHKDGNGLNNRLENLKWGAPQENADHRKRDGATTRLSSCPTAIVAVVDAGAEMTYDLEVDGPWHNFSANGIVVHNSVNEYSARYSELPDEFYVPPTERVNPQGGVSAQSSDESTVMDNVDDILGKLNCAQEDAFLEYTDLVKQGVARELARVVTPMGTYTQWYWKIDLHNLFHFLKLRMDAHAQWEIRVFADAIAEIVKDWVPYAWEAFDDYVRNSVTFSAIEQQLLQAAIVIATHDDDVAYRNLLQLKEALSKGEWQEFVDKAQKLGLSIDVLVG